MGFTTKKKNKQTKTKTTTKKQLFRRAMLSFETLTYHDESASPNPREHALCTKCTMIVKMIKVNRPINCLEFM